MNGIVRNFAVLFAHLSALLISSSVLAPPALAQSKDSRELKSCTAISSLMKSQTLTFALFHSQVPGRLAVTTHEMRVTGNHYKLDAVSEAKGLLALMHSGQLTQHSEGLVVDRRGLEPVLYVEKRGKKPTREVEMDAQTKQVLFKKNGEKAAYLPGLQDRLSLVYQLAGIWACGNSETVGNFTRLPVTSTGKIETETFTVEAVEELELELNGKESVVKALRLSNKPKDKEDDVIRVWLAPSMNWTPVQIQVEEPKGTKMTQSLLRLGGAE
ncbi:MAG: DUF3108 domain-containing protein [Limnobacter sp.]|nr:DUF3108 domain-containing protein [Limnobacter sp.]